MDDLEVVLYIQQIEISRTNKRVGGFMSIFLYYLLRIRTKKNHQVGVGWRMA